MELDPSRLTIADRSKLMTGCIVPRPIAFVSTISPDGRPNLAPFSFFAGVGTNPMTLLFCPADGSTGQEKDSLRNAKPVSEGGQGEFVVNVVTEDYDRQMAACDENLPYGESEFGLSGLHEAPSLKVRPPRLAESPVCFECKTLQVIRTNPGQPHAGNIVLGEVVHMFVRDGYINERYHTDAALLKAVGRMSGGDYIRTASPEHRYTLPRGRAALVPPSVG